MGFWRKEVIDPALDDQTRRSIEEQKSWIASEPSSARPYYNLALLYRMQWKQDEALGLLLEAVAVEPDFGDAHAALAEIYAVKDDLTAAWRHARLAESAGVPRAVEMLLRHGKGGDR